MMPTTGGWENYTPSERVFSMCGLVEEISKKLTSLSGSMILRYPEAFFKIPKFDQVINCQKVAQIGYIGSSSAVWIRSPEFTGFIFRPL